MLSSAGLCPVLKQTSVTCGPFLGLCVWMQMYNIQIYTFLELFKTRLDDALSNLIEWVVSLPMAGELELDDL